MRLNNDYTHLFVISMWPPCFANKEVFFAASIPSAAAFTIAVLTTPPTFHNDSINSRIL